ncbi:MAG: hypothetical protein QNJ40_13670 [Xanthomonadales bacterium]|nr:hypothetical protein [Xanthomonadales bacterium]
MRRNAIIRRWAGSLELALSTAVRLAVACLALVWLSPDLLSLVAGWAGYGGDWTGIDQSGACHVESLISQLGGITR